MAKVYSIDGKAPVIDPAAFVHPEAVLIGDVRIGPGCYVGPCACLRGDFGRIRLEAGAVVQDTCVIHTFPGEEAIIILRRLTEDELAKKLEGIRLYQSLAVQSLKTMRPVES